MELLARAATAPSPSLAERERLLLAWAGWLAGDSEGMALAITAATAKPVQLARGEVARALATLRGTAAACARLAPQPVDLGDGARATIHRVPLGPALAVTPFNFPLNLALHKLAPAIAAGCPVILKPSPKAPGIAERFLAGLDAAGIPPGLVQLANLDDAAVAGLCADPRLALLSFTGSAPVGRALQRLAWRARSVLELGGNAALVWHRVRDVPAAAARAAFGACAQAGQTCVSVQRIFVPADRPEWVDALVGAFRGLPSGDPFDPRTVNGPVIDAAAKERIAAALAGYGALGGRVLAGGAWDGLVLAPTLVDGLAPDAPGVADQELFAPIATLHRYRDLDEALAAVDATPFGLQAGLYSDDEAAIARAFARLRVGSLVIDDLPGRRDDRLPYGGMKESGCGREGTMEALLDYTQPKVLFRA
jgi:acyl-CoA reductase-like NAD-dependent aldehyde dehydrogenase